MGLFSSCFGDIDDVAFNGRRAAGRRVAITKAMIGTPSNFVHTGHLGIGTVRGEGTISKSNDPEKLKELMSQVSAALDENELFDKDSKTELSNNSNSSTSSKTSSIAIGMVASSY